MWTLPCHAFAKFWTALSKKLTCCHFQHGRLSQICYRSVSLGPDELLQKVSDLLRWMKANYSVVTMCRSAVLDNTKESSKASAQSQTMVPDVTPLRPVQVSGVTMHSIWPNLFQCSLRHPTTWACGSTSHKYWVQHLSFHGRLPGESG